VSCVTTHLISSEYQGESIFFDVGYINWFHRCLTKDGMIFIDVLEGILWGLSSLISPKIIYALQLSKLDVDSV